MPDVLEDRGPGRDANTGSYKDGDFVIEDVFSWGTVRPVDADLRHLHAVLKGNLVHAHGIKSVIFFSLSGASAKGITECPRPVTYLADVNGDVGIVWAGGYGKRMPLRSGDRRYIDEKPLASLVAHAWLAELDLHGVVGVANDFLYGGFAASTNFTVDALDEVESTRPELPSPALVSYAMCPKVLSCKGRVRIGRVAHEAACCVGIHSEEEWDKKVMSVPKRLKGLLSDFGVGGCIHQKHAQKHNVAGDTTSLSIVYLDCRLWSDLRLLHVVETVLWLAR